MALGNFEAPLGDGLHNLLQAYPSDAENDVEEGEFIAPVDQQVPGLSIVNEIQNDTGLIQEPLQIQVAEAV